MGRDPVNDLLRVDHVREGLERGKMLPRARARSRGEQNAEGRHPGATIAELRLAAEHTL